MSREPGVAQGPAHSRETKTTGATERQSRERRRANTAAPTVDNTDSTHTASVRVLAADFTPSSQMRSPGRAPLRLGSIFVALCLCICAAAVSAQTPECSIAQSCLICTGTTECEWCAFEGAGQGSGSCVLSGSPNATACVDPAGTIITQGGECAVAGVTCASATTCGACANAAEELHCGWCAASNSCVAGTIAGPNSGSCGTPSVDWGFQSLSCTGQARCNAASHSTCANCSSVSLDCGWCGSTGRCEIATQEGQRPFSNDCPQADWFYNSCNAPITPPCSSEVVCGRCESLPAASECGWCDSEALCMQGNSTGPTNGVCQGGLWSFQSCPSDAACLAASDCPSCGSMPNCLWCVDTGSCMPGASGPTPTDNCQNYILSGDSCEAPSPSSSGYPAAGVFAIFLLVVLIPLSLASCLFVGITKRFAPAPSPELARMGSIASKGEGAGRWVSFVVAVLLCVAKLVALALDTWDQSSNTLGSDTLVSKYGVLSVRSSSGQGSSTTKYADLCTQLNALSGSALSQQTSMCKTLRAGGILTLTFGLGSLLASTALGAVLFAAAYRKSIGDAPLRLWRLACVTSLASLSTLLFWLSAGHQIIHHDDGQAALSISMILFSCSWMLDLVMVLAMRRETIKSSPTFDPEERYKTLNAQERHGPYGHYDD